MDHFTSDRCIGNGPNILVAATDPAFTFHNGASTSPGGSKHSHSPWKVERRVGGGGLRPVRCRWTVLRVDSEIVNLGWLPPLLNLGRLSRVG